MNKKRTLLTIVALILVCVLSVMGTLAYLQAKTTTVTNTFVAAGGPGPFVDKKDGVEQFQLLEYKVNQSSTGKYASSTEEVAENSYSVLQGTTIPKQVFVKLSRTGVVEDGKTITPAPAYLYLEVANGLDAQEYTWSVDAANWKLLGTVTADGKSTEIYQYIGSLSDSNNVLTTVEADTKVDVITDDKVVANDVTLTEGEFKLSFNAYLAQASIGESDDAVTVFETCFGKDITVPTSGDGE